ncbi:uncharacterized protein LOC128822428 [Vidua macroura]|uniref:uncharacterized protein LOC128822428 n=1 Tax=Vidua macroura TaxID=187451 RepID=UPI0023A7D9B1|nr:uncharacterized protein LOC128822428 [Vidua macroura]
MGTAMLCLRDGTGGDKGRAAPLSPAARGWAAAGARAPAGWHRCSASSLREPRTRPGSGRCVPCPCWLRRRSSLAKAAPATAGPPCAGRGRKGPPSHGTCQRDRSRISVTLGLGGSGQLQHERQERCRRQLPPWRLRPQQDAQGLQQKPGSASVAHPGGCPTASCPLPTAMRGEVALAPRATRASPGQRRGGWARMDSSCTFLEFSICQSPVSWEDWTPELLQVKNSKSNIFLVVFLYSN